MKTENKARWITGLSLLGVVVAVGIIDNYTIIWAFLGIFYLIGFDEAIKLYDIKDGKKLYIYPILLWIMAYFYPSPSDLFFLMAMFIGANIAYGKGNLQENTIMPFLYPTVGFLFMLMLYNMGHIEHLFWLLIIVVFTDVGAFFVGKTIGKTPFSPTSPNKTIEGVIGGILFATIFGSLYGYTLELHPLAVVIAISILTAISSVFGDLFESYIKRRAGVKDSGTLLPGHGGVLDRLDGYLFASIMMFICLRVVTQ